ncbi:MAG: adenosylmethionine decarboxylase, partial [Burkholderiaceae bacterium]|nr:adenosylmethionine decarboxylase [Burkholderiaceae bacterium]
MSDSPLGRHVLADLQGVDVALLVDAAAIETLLTRAALAAGATPIFAKFHHFGAGQGVTGVLLLAESHISIHTWPEHGFAAVDAFMCGSAQPELAVDIVCQALRPERYETRCVE